MANFDSVSAIPDCCNFKMEFGAFLSKIVPYSTSTKTSSSLNRIKTIFTYNYALDPSKLNILLL